MGSVTWEIGQSIWSLPWAIGSTLDWAKWLIKSSLLLSGSPSTLQQPVLSHSQFYCFYSWCVLRFLLFLTLNSRDLTTKNRAGMGSRELAQLVCLLAKSSFHPFRRMQPPLPSLWQRARQPSRPMAHTPLMAPFIWSTLCWLSCKYYSSIRFKSFILNPLAHCLLSSLNLRLLLKMFVAPAFIYAHIYSLFN